MAPLYTGAARKPFEFTEEMRTAFEDCKKLIGKD